ncbi:unnamed protein product [Nezara viridula]|uniref:Uncharacterized protein n=1 Tax=Nezara viridula TaxID=85310 RepID=A0A9P0GUR9_NEZVI|nr:unnamed protein product [Nezara viridula]
MVLPGRGQDATEQLGDNRTALLHLTGAVRPQRKRCSFLEGTPVVSFLIIAVIDALIRRQQSGRNYRGSWTTLPTGLSLYAPGKQGNLPQNSPCFLPQRYRSIFPSINPLLCLLHLDTDGLACQLPFDIVRTQTELIVMLNYPPDSYPPRSDGSPISRGGCSPTLWSTHCASFAG